jgi:hypothetical protein
MTKIEISKEGLDDAVRDLNKTFYLSTYEGFEVAMLAVIKMAESFQGKKELDRIVSLFKIIPEEKIKDVLSDSAVDELLNVRPLLETLLSNQHESINDDHTAHELKELIRLRTADPKAALSILIVVLKRIRDHRVRGFETNEGSRDEVIFRASLRLLYKLGRLAAESLGSG